MLRILLAEAELELVPESIWGHPNVRKAVKASGRKAAEMLLDQNAHQHACRQLDDGARRGRPDIVQYCLLSLLESPLAKQGELEVAIHTRHGQLIRIRPDTRLPRGEGRFQGLMAKVLQTGASQDGPQPLVHVEATCSPAEALERFGRGPVLRLDEGGKHIAPQELANHGKHDKLTLLLGAYPSGAWSQAWQSAAPETARIFDQPLNAWAVAAECVAGYRSD
ncbi:MAG: hypothetical protein ACPHID_00810 [Thermoplasmatota archaeon]